MEKFEQDDEIVIDLADLGRALVKSKKLIAGATAGCIALAAAYLVIAKPSYESDSLLRIKPPTSIGKSLLDSIPLSNAAMAKQLVTTYSEILKSRKVVMPVLEKNEYFEEGKDKNKIYEDFIKTGVVIKPFKDTDMMQVTVTADDAKKAPKVNNELLQAFLLRLNELNHVESTTNKIFVEERVTAAKKALDQAEAKLVAFRKDNDLINPERTAGMVTSNLSKMDGLKASNKVDLESARAKLASVTSQMDANLMSIAENGTVSAYRSKLTNLESTRISYLDLYTENHPKVIEINNQIAETKAMIEQEIANIAASKTTAGGIYNSLLGQKLASETAIKVAESNLATIANLEAQYKADVAKLSDTERDFVTLTREKNVAQDLYVMLTKRLEEAKIAEKSVSNEVTLVDEASVPTKPAKPKKAMTLILACLLGFFGSSAYVVARELLNPKVKKGEDVVDQLHLDLLAEVPADQEGQLAAYRVLRTNLMAKKDVQTVLFASSSDAQAKSAVVAELAKLMARAGLKVALLNTSGLTNLVAGKANLQASAEANLSLCQATGVDGGEVLAGKAVEAVLADLKSQYDYVLIDAPVTSESSEATILCNKVDGLVEVVKAEVLSPKEEQAAVAAYKQAGAKVLGAVLVK